MSNKWQIGPVKLVNGDDAWIDAINEGQKHYRYTGRIKLYNQWTAVGWDDLGRKMYSEIDSPGNLVPPPKKKIKVERWVNVFEDGGMVSWPTKEDADNCNQEARFALIQIDLEVEEGEGLRIEPVKPDPGGDWEPTDEEIQYAMDRCGVPTARVVHRPKLGDTVIMPNGLQIVVHDHNEQGFTVLHV